MALFEGFKRIPGSRSNTKLVVSHGDSPAEKWIVDPSLPVLFTNPYGGYGQEEVVIGKGMIVALNGQFVKDYETGKMVPVLTIADGSNMPIGMAPYNLAKYDPRWFKMQQPAIITREYVELPLFRNADDAAAVHYGAAIGDLKPGDLVKVTNDPNNKGKLVKWNEGDPISQIVGQVLGAEMDQEPHGWLKWALWDETAKRQDDAFINRKRGVEPTDNGWPYDPTYRDGTRDFDGYLSQFTSNPTGVPGLHDGAERSKTVWTKVVTLAAGTTAGTKIVITLDHKNLVKGSVVVKRNGVVQPEDTFTVDHKLGQVTYTVPADVSADEQLTVEYRANFYGILPGWDFVGVTGAVRILLKF